MTLTDSEIPVRPYGKAELAHMYKGHGCTDSNARHWLNIEIRKCPGLLDELHRLGYSPTQKVFTLAQVRAIFNAIGKPEGD